MSEKLPALKGTATPKFKVRRPIASALSYRNMRLSKSRPDRICLKQQSEVASLRSEVASLREAVAALQAAARPKAVPVDAEERGAERGAAKRKRAEEREAAKQDHAAFLAKQALTKPNLAEWQAKDTARQKARKAVTTKLWHAANPEKVKAANRRQDAKRKAQRAEARKAKEQIPSRPELLGEEAAQ